MSFEKPLVQDAYSIPVGGRQHEYYVTREWLTLYRPMAANSRENPPTTPNTLATACCAKMDAAVASDKNRMPKTASGLSANASRRRTGVIRNESPAIVDHIRDAH